MDIIILSTKDEVINKLAEKIEEISNETLKNKGRFYIGVSGGSLVKFLEIGLLRIKTDFAKWQLFFCDERVVSEDNPDSTYGCYRENLARLLDLRENQFVRIKQGVSAHEAADDYRRQMAAYFSEDTLPQFDLLLLGMGPDGHTCSLFPGHQLLAETERWVVPIIDSPKPPPERITLTLPVINNSSSCIFAITGKEKADMIKNVLQDKLDLPVSRVKLTHGKLFWILDKDAAIHLNKE